MRCGCADITLNLTLTPNSLPILLTPVPTSTASHIYPSSIQSQNHLVLLTDSHLLHISQNNTHLILRIQARRLRIQASCELTRKRWPGTSTKRWPPACKLLRNRSPGPCSVPPCTTPVRSSRNPSTWTWIYRCYKYISTKYITHIYLKTPPSPMSSQSTPSHAYEKPNPAHKYPNPAHNYPNPAHKYPNPTHNTTSLTTKLWKVDTLTSSITPPINNQTSHTNIQTRP